MATYDKANKTLVIWTSPKDKKEYNTNLKENFTDEIHFNENGDLITWDEKKKITQQWSNDAKKIGEPVSIPLEENEKLYFSPQGQLIKTSTKDNGIYLWNYKNNSFKKIIHNQNIAQSTLHFSPDSLIILDITTGRMTKWNSFKGKTSTTELPIEFNPRTQSIYFASLGKFIIKDNSRGTLQFFHKNGNPLEKNKIKASSKDIKISPTGKIISWDKQKREITIWNNEGTPLKKQKTQQIINHIEFELTRTEKETFVTIDKTNNTLQYWHTDGSSTSNIIQLKEKIDKARFISNKSLAIADYKNGILCFHRNNKQSDCHKLPHKIEEIKVSSQYILAVIDKKNGIISLWDENGLRLSSINTAESIYDADFLEPSGTLITINEKGVITTWPDLIHWEIPRLCRGDVHSLTYPEVHPETLKREPPSTCKGESEWTSLKA